MSDLRARTRDVLRHPGFIRYLTARLLATLAAQTQTVAVGWQVYAITRDPLDLGLIGLSQFLPFVVLILPAGQIADHYDRRRIVTLCYATELICALMLLFFTMRGMTATWPVFAAMLLLGSARAFSMPSGQALLPNLVPPENFSRALALNSSVFQIATVLGPALGGVLYSSAPRTSSGNSNRVSLQSGGAPSAPSSSAASRRSSAQACGPGCFRCCGRWMGFPAGRSD